MLQKWNEKYEWPKLRTAVASEFFKTVESQYADRIETIRGAWPDWWTDGFASGAREAAISRVTHSDIIANQAGLSFAKMLGAQLPKDINDRIQDINKALLFYDEHTFGHSESVRNGLWTGNLGTTLLETIVCVGSLSPFRFAGRGYYGYITIIRA